MRKIPSSISIRPLSVSVSLFALIPSAPDVKRKAAVFDRNTVAAYNGVIDCSNVKCCADDA